MPGLEFGGVPHGALADARNTALVHAAILRRIRRNSDPIPVPPEPEAEPEIRSDFGDKLAKALASSG